MISFNVLNRKFKIFVGIVAAMTVILCLLTIGNVAYASSENNSVGASANAAISTNNNIAGINSPVGTLICGKDHGNKEIILYTEGNQNYYKIGDEKFPYKDFIMFTGTFEKTIKVESGCHTINIGYVNFNSGMYVGSKVSLNLNVYGTNTIQGKCTGWQILWGWLNTKVGHPGIELGSNSTLKIDGHGTLTATGSVGSEHEGSAGIGTSTNADFCSNIYIGPNVIVYANGADGGAGIGAGAHGKFLNNEFSKLTMDNPANVHAKAGHVTLKRNTSYDDAQNIGNGYNPTYSDWCLV